MANLAETNTWETGIYQFEEADVVQGGAAGIDNVPTRQLANRTLYLKNLVEALGTGKLDIAALATQAQAIAGTDNATWMTPLRVAQAIAALATVVMASETVAGKVELATSAETVTGTDTSRATHPAGVKAAITAAVASLVNSSPATLDTLNELAAALGNDPNFATSIASQIAGKQNADATLTALSALTTAADKLIYATGADAFATATLTAFARTLLDDADAAAARATLGAASASLENHGIGGTAAGVPGGNIDATAIPCGMYYTTSADTGTKPAGDDGFGHLMVSREGANGLTVRQIFQDSSTTGIWVRLYLGSWGPWLRLTTTNDTGGLLPINGSGAMTGKLVGRGGAAGGNNPNNAGFVFDNDQDSGLFCGSDGVVDIVANGQLAIRANAVGNEREIFFGPGNNWRLRAQSDGNVAVLDSTDVVKFDSAGYSAIYSKSLAASGYQKIPGGLILQWQKTGTISTNGNQAITWPIAFPNACLAAFPGLSYAGTATHDSYSIGGETTTGCTVYANGAGGVPAFVFSIGF